MQTSIALHLKAWISYRDLMSVCVCVYLVCMMKVIKYE